METNFHYFFECNSYDTYRGALISNLHNFNINLQLLLFGDPDLSIFIHVQNYIEQTKNIHPIIFSNIGDIYSFLSNLCFRLLPNLFTLKLFFIYFIFVYIPLSGIFNPQSLHTAILQQTTFR